MTLRTTTVLTFLTALTLGACSDESDVTSPLDDTTPTVVAAASIGGTPATGRVVTATNAPGGNELLVFSRDATGALTKLGAYSTGGLGTGGGLGNQGGVTLSSNAQWLLAVNAGSDDVSLFRMKPEFELVDRVPSHGSRPISVAIHGSLVYVLNAGGDGNVAGFAILDGALQAIPGAVYPLSDAGVGPAQVGFAPDGRTLVVTEKGTNRIVVYPVYGGGTLGAPQIVDSSGQTPFGFEFSRVGTLVVSEAFGGSPGASAVSSYRLDGAGGLDVVSATLATTQTAACWIVITPNGRFAFTTNAGSGTISSFGLAADGGLTLIEAVAAGTAGDGPIDMSISRNGRFLTVLNGGAQALATYRVRADGRLEPVDGGTYTGLPTGTNGLAAF